MADISKFIFWSLPTQSNFVKIMNWDPQANYAGPEREANAQDSSPWPKPIEYNTFEITPVEKPKPIIDGLLDGSSRMIFGGGSKTYKTWAMSEQALCICSGVPWWGFITHRVRVLYVNFELKEYYFQRRLRAIRQAKKISVDTGMFFIWNLRGYDIRLGAFKTNLLDLIRFHAIVVVFIDPFYRLLGDNDERISAELMPILSMFEELNRMTDVSIVCGAHFSKGNQAAKEPLDRISGGGNLNRHPDNLITLTKHEAEQAFTVDFTCRDFAPIDPFVVKWEHPLLIRADALDPAKIKTVPGRKRQFTAEQIIEVLKVNDDQFSTAELQQAVQEETGMSRSAFYGLWTQLKIEKKIFKSKMTGNWNLRI